MSTYKFDHEYDSDMSAETSQGSEESGALMDIDRSAERSSTSTSYSLPEN